MASDLETNTPSSSSWTIDSKIFSAKEAAAQYCLDNSLSELLIQRSFGSPDLDFQGFKIRDKQGLEY